jgi:major membrane immunogen (membrane-anchored lipoprotein)
MKKTIQIVAIITILAISLVLLVGCGSKLKGKYTLVSMSSGGVTVDAETIRGQGMNPDDMYLEFDGDKCKVSIAGENGEGTYKVEGKDITITIDDDPASGTIDGKKITLTIGAQSMTFEKK